MSGENTLGIFLKNVEPLVEEIRGYLRDTDQQDEEEKKLNVSYNAGLYRAMQSICRGPAVDAVEVVRCCRCRFAVNKREHGEMVTCCALDWGMRGALDPNDFCSYGKEIKRCQD